MTEQNSRPEVHRAADHRKMPWKNGLGVTTEIMVSPDGAGLTDFDWRVSMATVSSDGGFSNFKGVDRTLAVLSGDGLNLIVGDTMPVELTKASPPHSFPADAVARATLLGQPVVDLNVMTRRGTWRHTVKRVSREFLRLGWQAQSEISMWFCAQGEVSFNDDASLHDSLQTGDAMWLRPQPLRPVRIEVSSHAALFLIELDRVDS